MTVIVGATTGRGAVIASDSVHYEIVAGSINARPAIPKVIKTERGHLVGVAGISHHNGYDFLAALGRAMDQAAKPQDLGDCFMRSAGQRLVSAFVAWSGTKAFTGQDPRNFFEAVAAWSDEMTGMSLWRLTAGLQPSAEGGPELVLGYDSPREVPDQATVMVVGAHDNELDIYDCSRRYERFLRGTTLSHNVAEIPGPSTVAQLSQVVHDLVHAQIQRGVPPLPGDPWPAHLPTVSGAVQLVTAGA